MPIGRRLTYREITPELELELVRRCQAGDTAAGGVLVDANEPLIYSKARWAFGRGLDTADVLQSARLGYYRGILEFDASSGNRLNTYAMWWSLHEVNDAIQQTGSTIRLPKRVHEALFQAAKSGEPLTDKLAEAKRLRYTKSTDAPIGNRAAFSLSSASWSGDSVGDTIPGEAALPDDAVADADARARCRDLVGRALTRLTARQREVIERHLLAEEPEPFEAIGAALGVTKQGAEELQKRAKAKLLDALRVIMAPDDAVLWGGSLPAGPMRPRKPVAAPASAAPPIDEPPPASRVMAKAKRRRATAARAGSAGDTVAAQP